MKRKRETQAKIEKTMKLIPDELLDVAIEERWNTKHLMKMFSADIDPDFYVTPIPHQIEIIKAAAEKLTLASSCREANVPYFVGRWWYDNDPDFRYLFDLARDAAVDLLESKEYAGALDGNGGAGKILTAYRKQYQPQKASESQAPLRVRVVFGQGGGAIEVTAGNVKDALLGVGSDDE